jgi:hypothetical protein
MASLVVTSTRRLQKPACLAILVVTLTGCGASGNNSANGHSGASTLSPRTRAPAIRLMPASAVVRRSCLRAARRFTVTIYCPMRVPAHWVADLICIDCNGTFSITGGFTAPRNYVGMVRGSGHFTVWAATPGVDSAGLRWLHGWPAVWARKTRRSTDEVDRLPAGIRTRWRAYPAAVVAGRLALCPVDAL